MSMNKRQQAHTERDLIAALTTACETAKAEIPGFQWLTHQLDFAAFPASLVVVWVFDTQASKDRALAQGLSARMVELTAEALAEIAISLDAVARHVHFDSEEQCARINAGNWLQRLARLRPSRG